MPGILPMKVIKVGSTAQSRIAQACDRCRSKKIRCDGIRPCCSQCSNVGFECKTSDKLSRRAFPRGYTESLEERVRALEAEVRELKDLLDEKDEKIDMLSKMHSNIGDMSRRRMSSASVSACAPAETIKEELPVLPKDDVFRVQASPLLLGSETSDSYFMGASSGRAFVDAFKRKVQESGKSLAGFNTDAFLNVQSKAALPSLDQYPKTSIAPPRMFSDRCVNVYFQEWAPLFPVLHKPTFLRLYEEYMGNPEKVTDLHKLAQLNLVFGIAGLSSDIPDREHIAFCESQWRSCLDLVLMDNTLVTLQTLVLAMMFCISKADYSCLQHYKGIAIGLSHRLGLHQSQKRFSFGALTIETRKKVFWTLYTVDCFSAALLGLPKLLKEDDIHAEYPSDTDDEYVTEKGFQPTLPGEFTKISSALALFRASRILSKVLDQNYPAAAAHDLTLQSLASLENELNEWSDDLPQHLKLTFRQEKPSTDVTGSRSAVLSLAFYYIRSLIHRPAVGSSLGNKSSPSVISLADSSKHIIQIVQLLEERSMSFSICLNKNEMLTLCGLSLLYQGLDLKQEGKLMQDGQRLVAIVIKYLEKANAPGAADFKRLAGYMINLESHQKIQPPPKLKSDSTPPIARKQLQPQIYKHTSMSESDLLSQQEKLRRAAMPNAAVQTQDKSNFVRNSMESIRPRSPMSIREYRNSVPQLPAMTKPQSDKNTKPPNLDYLSLNNTSATSQPRAPSHTRTHQPIHNNIYPTTTAYATHKASTATATTTASEWEVLLGTFDDRNIYDAIYGGGAAPVSLNDSTPSNLADWSPDSWDYTMGLDFMNNAPPPTSVLSFSDESLSSGDDLSASDLSLSARQDYKPALIAGSGALNDGYDFLLEGLDRATVFGL